MGRAGCLRSLLAEGATALTCAQQASTSAAAAAANQPGLQQALQVLQGASQLLASQSASISSSGWHASLPAGQLHHGTCRHFSNAAPPDSSPSADVSTIGNPKVQQLAADILALSVLESSWLTEILRKKLNLQKPAFGAMPAFAMPAAAAPAAATAPAAAAAEAAKEEKKEEKSTFEIKLESFTADGKIKVIKEIRAITNLGLKEAKELVEKAPVVIKDNVAKADAEKFKKLIEAAGGKVALV